MSGQVLTQRAHLPAAQIEFERHLELLRGGVRIRESVQSLSACDRPIGWTQHVTLGPPFLEKGLTQFRASATRSKVFERPFGVADLRRFTDTRASSAYTAHLMDRSTAHAFFVAFSPALHLAFGYVWKGEDFPWLGIWQENLSRTHTPWDGVTLACGMEFGASPMPESRREMIDRGRLFDVPTFRWIPAKSRVEVVYWAIARDADAVPDVLTSPLP